MIDLSAKYLYKLESVLLQSHKTLSRSINYQALLACKMNELELHPLILPALFSLLILLWSIIKWFYQRDAMKNLAPSPPKLPILGNLHQLGSLPHRSLRALARKYGPLMLLHLGRVPVLIVSSADAASEIFKTHDIAFSSRPEFKASKKLMMSDAKDVTFLPYGEYWRQLKSIFVLQLSSAKRPVQSFRFIREDETTFLVKKIGESSGPVNLSVMLSEFSTDVISRSVLGCKYRELENGKNHLALVVEMMKLLGIVCIGDFIPWLSWTDRVRGFDERLNKVTKGMDALLEDVMQRRLEVDRNSGECFVDILQEIHNGNGDGDSIDRDDIKALLMVSGWAYI